MSRMQLAAMAVCLAGTLFAAPAVRAQDAAKTAKIAITPDSTDAVIILKAEQVPNPPTYRTSYRLNLQTFDPEAQTMRGGPFGGSVTIAARPKAFVGDYMVLTVKPGTYAIRDFSRQDYWALCFHASSLQFTVRPGEVLYLGEFDAPGEVEELERIAVMSGQLSTRGEPVHFFEGVSTPSFAPVDEAGLAAAAEMVRKQMPKTTVAPKAAQFSAARFGTGSDLFGLKRVCGGYFQKRAK